MKRGFAVTYEVITPESAADSDAADRGYLVDGWQHSTVEMHSEHAEELRLLRDQSVMELEPDEDETVVDAAHKMLRREGVVEASASPASGPTADSWFSGASSEDFRTGEGTIRSYHPVGLTDDEVREVARRLGLR